MRRNVPAVNALPALFVLVQLCDVMCQALATVLVVPNAVSLAANILREPDAGRVVKSEIPPRIDRHTRAEWDLGYPALLPRPGHLCPVIGAHHGRIPRAPVFLLKDRTAVLNPVNRLI